MTTFPARRYVTAVHTSVHKTELLDEPFIGRPSLMHLLADNECPHGSLPGDRVVTCTCWPQRRT